MKKLYILCLFILLNIIANATNAAINPNAELLLKNCKSPGVSYQSYCIGYIKGFYDGRIVGVVGSKSLNPCLPKNSDGTIAITYGQMKLIFINWANNHPEDLHLPDWLALGEAVVEAYPCTK